MRISEFLPWGVLGLFVFVMLGTNKDMQIEKNSLCLPMWDGIVNDDQSFLQNYNVRQRFDRELESHARALYQNVIREADKRDYVYPIAANDGTPVFFEHITTKKCREEYNGHSVFLHNGYIKIQSSHLGNYIEYKKQLTDYAHQLAISYQTKFEQAERIVVKSQHLTPKG